MMQATHTGVGGVTPMLLEGGCRYAASRATRKRRHVCASGGLMDNDDADREAVM